MALRNGGEGSRARPSGRAAAGHHDRRRAARGMLAVDRLRRPQQHARHPHLRRRRASASSPRRGSSDTRSPAAPTVPGERPLQVAVVFDRIATSPEAVVSIDGIRESAWATGHVVTICETLDNPEMERRALDAVMHGETDLVVYATIMTRKVEVPRRLYAAQAARRAAQLLQRRPRLPERRAGRGGGRPPRDRRADRCRATSASPSSPASCGWTRRATG